MAFQATGRAKLRFGIFEADVTTRELYKRGVLVPLQDKPFQVLAVLLERPGELITREELQNRLWPNGTFVDFEKGLNTAVRKLRDALGDSAETPLFIETLSRRGYRLIAPININGSGMKGSLPVAAVGLGEHTGGAEAVFDADVKSLPSAEIPSRAVRPRYWPLIMVLALTGVSAVLVFGRFQWRTRNRNLDLKDMQITKLTDNGKVRHMAISPDGHFVTYALRDGLDQSLWVKNVGSGNEMRLLPPDTVNFAGLAFSPDGQFIYFIRSEKSNPVFGYLCRMRAAGGTVEQLIRDADSSVSFSPDGKQFIYTRGYPPRNIVEVRLANADGTGDRLLATMSGHQVYEAGATWSPDNRAIAVPLNLIGQQSRFVLYIISLSDSKVEEIFSSPGAIGRPLWVRGNNQLLVTLEDERTHRGQLWTISYPNGDLQRFTNDLSDYSSAIDLTQDGRRLATIVTSTISNVWVASMQDLSHPYQLTSGEPSMFQVHELPRGKLLALGGGIWTMNSDATHRLRFADVPESQWIEPCGHFVLAVADEGGNAVLMRMNSDGSEQPTALASGDILEPACSPDGHFAYYMNFANPEKIRRISVEDGSTTDVADVLGDTLFGNVAVSPDGKFLAYPYQQYSPPLVALAVIPAVGGPPLKTFIVPGFLGRLRYSSDGKALQYLMTRNGATNLWEQPLRGGSQKQLTQFTSGQIFDFSWSADRTRLFLTRGQSTRDVVLIGDIREP